MKPTLLATAPTIERIEAMVRKFYGNPSMLMLIESGQLVWEVHTGRGFTGCVVRFCHGRYRFEKAAQP